MIIPQQLVEKLRFFEGGHWLLPLGPQLSDTAATDSQSGQPHIKKPSKWEQTQPKAASWAPCCCACSPSDCTARLSHNHIIKYVNSTTVMVLLSDNSESAYRMEADHLTAWCRSQDLALNVGNKQKKWWLISGGLALTITRHWPLTVLLWRGSVTLCS